MMNKRGVRYSVDEWLDKFGCMDSYTVLSESDDCIVIQKKKSHPLVPSQTFIHKIIVE